MSKKLIIGLISGLIVLVGAVAVVLAVVFAGGDDRHEHDLMHHEAVAATCIEDGTVEHWSCSECGKNFADANASEEITELTIPATGHTPGEAVRENEKAATCEEAGSYEEVVYCTVCHEEISRETQETAALGHSFTNYVSNGDAKCTEDGTETAKCDRCDATDTRTDEDSALGHDWVETITKEPTCTVAGEKVMSCSRCDETKTEVIPAAGHAPREAVRENEKAATCTEAGSYEEVVYCTVCHEEISRETVETAALGHSFTNYVSNGDAKCTEDGTETAKCDRCDATDTRTDEDSALGHDWVETITKEPTCTVAGEKVLSCSRCDETKTEVIPAAGHTPGEAVRENEKAETCEEAGSYDVVVYCTVCKEEISRETQETAALGHSFTQYVSNNDAKCTEDGTETAKCDRCDATDTRTDEDSALGHDWVETEVTKEPTCTVVGVKVMSCSRCDGTKTEAVPATGHTPGEAVRENEKAATCETAGSYEEVVYCTVCGTEISRETVTTAPATGHSFSSQWSSDENAHWHASTCGHEVTADYAAHTFVEGICSVCGYEQGSAGQDEETLEYVLSNDGRSYIVKGIGSVTSSSVTIPDTYKGLPVTEIAEGAFQNCTFVSISISVNITYIGADAFKGCTNLVAVYYGGMVNSWVNIVFVNIYSNPLYVGHHLYIGGSLVENLVIPAGVTEIKDFAFAGGVFVTINIDVTVVIIGEDAFKDCTGVDRVEYGGTVSQWVNIVFVNIYSNPLYVGHHFYIGGDLVVELVIPEGVTEIKDYAFAGGIFVTIDISVTVVIIGEDAFKDCTGVDRVEYGGTVTEWVNIVFVNIYSNPLYVGHHLYIGGSLVENLVIPAGVTEIKDFAFAGGIFVTINIDVTVVIIGDGVFSGTVSDTVIFVGTEDWWIKIEIGEGNDLLDDIIFHKHQYSSVVTKEPTCTETGVRTYICSCGDSYTRVIPALGHDWTIEVEKEPTCTEAGSILYACTRCEESYRITTHAAHNYELIETVAATCTKDGYQLFRCSVCGEEYRIVIPAEAGHNYVGEVTLAPTTEREGEMTYTCTRCGDSYTVPLAKLHSGSGYVLLIQDRLPWTTDNNAVILNYLTDSQQIDGWELVTSAQAASVDFGNYDVIYIANDQTTATYNRLGALNDKLTQFAEGGGVLIYGASDHGWGAGDISYDLPGGVSIGNYYSNYNYIVDDTHDIITGVLTGGKQLTNDLLYSTYSSHTTFHDLPEGSKVILQDAKGDPTLVEYALGNGYVIASGLTWEYTYERTFVDGTSFAKEIYDDLFVYAMMLADPCEHEYEKGETVAPTCTEDGYTVYTCKLCGRVYHGDRVTALGHTEVIEKGFDPTCTEPGLTDGIHCSVCGETLQEQEVIPALEHDYESEVTKQPTCTEAGERTYTCSACGDSYTEAIPALKHNYESEVTKQPTCTEAGERTYTCSRCGDSYTEAIPEKGHTVVIDEAVEATCTQPGLTEGSHCSVCEAVIVAQEVVPAKEHNYQSEVTKQPTCTEAGERTYTCTRCGDSYTEAIPALNHALKYVAAVEATCEKAGSVEYWTCSRCGKYFADDKAAEELESSTIPATGHTSGAAVKENEKKATCTEKGSYEEVVYCETCGKELSRETQVTDELGHNYVNGECTRCGEPEPDATEGLVFTLSDDGTYYSVTDYTGSAKEVYIPSICNGLPVSSIGREAFYACTSLTSIKIPNSVTSIGNLAFAYCSSLASITIPDSVTSIGGSAFYGCSGLTSITIPDSVTSIGNYAFYDCSGLTSITIPDSVTSIGERAFYRCDSLTSVTIGDGVTSIGESAFWECTRLTSVTIGDGVTSIGDSAFEGCGLTSIKIPDSVTSIGNWVFSGCDSLTSIIVSEGNPVYHSAGNCLIETASGTLIAGCTNSIIPNDGSVTSIGNFAFNGCTSLTSITIGDSVTSIGSGAFAYCESLTSITIPDSVTSIGEDAFYHCSSLTSITIPNSVTSIGNYAFYCCRGLTSITIPDSVTSIGNNAFHDCDGLTSVTIPDSVTSIGYRAFYGCDSLTSVYYTGAEEQWNNIHIGGSNSALTDADIYYYSESEPSDAAGNYWHYDENGTPVIW